MKALLKDGRKWVDYENGTFLIYEYSFGFRQAKTLEGIPAEVISAVKKICEYSATAAPRG